MKIRNKKLIALSSAFLFMTACGSESVVITKNDYTEISLSWWGNDARTEYTLEAVKQFEKLHPEIRVNCSYTEWSGYPTRYDIQLKSGTESDVMQINFPWLDKYSADGNGYYDLFTLSNTIDLGQYSDDELEFGIRNGRLNAIPIALNAQTLYYNKTLYDSFGLDIPQTWDDLFEAARVMNGKSYPLGMPSKSSFFLITAYVEQQTGKKIVDENGDLTFGEDELAMMVDFYTRLINEKVMPQVEYFDKNDIRNGTCGGTVAWLSDAENYMGATQEDGNEVVVGNYLGMTDTIEGWYAKPATLYAISGSTDHPTESAMLLEFLLNSSEVAELQKLEKGVPLSRSARSYLEEHDMFTGLHYDAFGLMSEHIGEMSIIRPFMENTDMLNDFEEACNAVLFDKTPLDEKKSELYGKFIEY